LPIWNREFKRGIVAGQQLEAVGDGHVEGAGTVSAILVLILEAGDQLGGGASSALLGNVGGLNGCWDLEYHVCSCGNNVLGFEGEGDGNWLLAGNLT